MTLRSEFALGNDTFLRGVYMSSTEVSGGPRRRNGHVQPKPPLISLDGPGRLTSANVIALLGISHSTLCLRLKLKTFPAPDFIDNRRLYWKTETIRALLEG